MFFCFDKFIVQRFSRCSFKRAAAIDDHREKIEEQIICQPGFLESIIGFCSTQNACIHNQKTVLGKIS